MVAATVGSCSVITKNTLVLVGGTGNLGIEIARGLITTVGMEKVALVRNVTKAKVLEQMGWKIKQIDDFYNVKILQNALSDAKIVISTFGKNDIVNLECTCIRAAKNAGVSLYIPSQFGVDYRRWGSHKFPVYAKKRKVIDYAKRINMPTLSVFTGLFSDMIFNFLTDPINRKAFIIGDGSAKISFTRRSDIGYVLAKALNDPEVILQNGNNNGTLSIEGDNMSWKEALLIFEKVLGDKPFDIEYIDPDTAYKQEKELLRKGLKGDPVAFSKSFALHVLGELERGNDGANVSKEAKSYGFKLERLEETLQDIYG